MTYTDQGVLLRREPQLEHDEYATLYLKSGGKYRALVVGSRKLSSKLSGTLAPFAELSLTLARGRTVDRIVGVEILELLPHVSRDPAGRLLAMLIARTLESVTTEEGDAHTYALVWRTWSAIERQVAQGTLIRPVAQFLFSSFVLKLLVLSGLKPDISRCAQCGDVFSQRVPSRFSSTLGGFLCTAHGQTGNAISHEGAHAIAALLETGEREGEASGPLRRGGSEARNQGNATYELGRATLAELVSVATLALGYHTHESLPARDVFRAIETIA